MATTTMPYLEYLRALGDHFVEFIRGSRNVLARRGQIIIPVGPEFTLADLEDVNRALEGRRPLGRKNWEAAVHFMGPGEPAIALYPA